MHLQQVILFVLYYTSVSAKTEYIVVTWEQRSLFLILEVESKPIQIFM